MDWHQNCSNPEKQKLEMKVMHKNSGFTLMELMTTIAIIAVLAAIAIPNMIGWRSKTKLQGAVENLRGDLKLAKLAAVRDSKFVAIKFSATGYLLFTDDEPDDDNTIGDLDEDDGERPLRERNLPAGVSIDLGSTAFNGNDYARFNNRGLPDLPGPDDKVELVTSSGKRGTIKLSPLGRVNIEYDL
jgi:type IV fimbrial biogenesis protein FimT